MDKSGSFLLRLQDANGNPWRGEARIQVYDDQDRMIFNKLANYTGPVRIKGLRPVPRGRHRFHVKTRHFVSATLYAFVLSDDGAPGGYHEANEADIPLLIDSEAADKCGALIGFPRWSELPNQELAAVQEALKEAVPAEVAARQHDQFHVRDTNGEEFYDGLVQQPATEHNHRRVACLLNLYAKLKQTRLAIGLAAGGKVAPWDLIETIVRLRQDRLYATVKPELIDPALEALDGMVDAGEVFATQASGWHGVAGPDGMEPHPVSYKSTPADKFGSVQLSLGWIPSNGGGKTWILDADIDEKSGIEHIVDEVIYHAFTGTKTSPYAVHQLLCMQGTPPRYPLVYGCG